MKAQKKPVVIDFLPVNDESAAMAEIKKWVENFGDNPDDHFYHKDGEGIFVKTLEGNSYAVTIKDVVIRGIQGEYYPCKKDVFEQTYDVLS
ncbi:MAG TPA: hypothetical protein VE978_21475 [Chitinophagales bacterium]|nr:hypothetical protein [Chitinophagales bacterium]